MTDAEPKGWKPLKLASRSKKPCLFYSYESSKSAVLLQLTDLVSIWRCSLSKAELISEASEQHCSIDPSESTDQFNVFLSKLGHSVQEGDNILAVGDDTEKSCLLLRTQISLPRPLQPLAFTFSLNLETSAEFSQTIVLPLLSSLSVQDSQLRSLEEQMKVKDHVIAKLLDRIDTQGVDMSIIFPALTGAGGRKGNVTIEVAKKRVTGMEAFDHDSWLKEFAGQNEDVARLKELIAGAHKANRSTGNNCDWMSQLPGRDVLEKANASQASIRASQRESQLRSQQVQKSDDETASEDEFERQATPPSLKKKITTKDQGLGNNPEISGSSENSAVEDKPPPKKRKTGNIRGIGGPKPLTKSKPVVNSSSSPIAAEPAPPSRRIETSDTDTASSSESDTDKSKTTKQQAQKPKLGGLRSNVKRLVSPTPLQKPSSPPVARPTSLHASTPSHRPGRIGNAHHHTATASPLPEATTSESLEAPTPSRRLGRIGIKKKTRTPSPGPGPDNAEPNSPSNASSTASDDDLDGPIITKPPTKKRKPPPISSPDKTPCTDPNAKQSQPPQTIDSNPKPPKPEQEPTAAPPLETEEEKTLRKKEELRKTFASGPAKKKRRF